ncbi:MAG TPA: redoxin domain-containing protein, partial [Candidatus Binataceae bacterium]|nr:redoxin domain-containing protein [Candidatus Binataceae bacterium]
LKADEPCEFRLLSSEALIGSSEDNQFVIRRSCVSRRHAALRFVKDQYELSDLGSTNGTFINGQRITGRTRVELGDEIRIGDAAFIVAKPVCSGSVRPGKSNLPKKVLTFRGACEIILLTFAVGFGAAQYLAYLTYHEQSRLILAEAVPLNQSPTVHVPSVPQQPSAPVPSKTIGHQVSSETQSRRPASKSSNSDTFAVRELAGGNELSGLITGSGTKAGLPAPDFGLMDLNGKRVTLHGLQGNIVLLNFWATWCGSCRSEMPSLEHFYRQFHSYSDLAVLTVSVDARGKPAVAQFMASNQYDFPVLLDENNTTGGAYGVSGIPSTFVIGRDGKIIWNCVGALDWSNPRISEILMTLLCATVQVYLHRCDFCSASRARWPG